MTELTQNKINIVRFLVTENREVSRNEMIKMVDDVNSIQYIHKIIDADNEMKKIITIRDMDEDDPYKKQKRIGYKIKNDILSLRKIFFTFYNSNNQWKLLHTEFFDNLIDDIIEDFNKRLELSDLKKRLTPGETDYLKCCIRYPSVASFVLNEGISVVSVVNYQKSQDECMLNKIIKYINKTYQNEFKHNDKAKRFINKLLPKILNVSSIWIKIFSTLMQNDRFFGRLPSDIDIEYQKIIDEVEGPIVVSLINNQKNEMDKLL